MPKIDLDSIEQARIEAASVFEQWQALLADALRAMVAAGQLQPEADLDRLALAGDHTPRRSRRYGLRNVPTGSTISRTAANRSHSE